MLVNVWLLSQIMGQHYRNIRSMYRCMVFAAILLLTPIAHTIKWFRKEMILFIWLELYLERDFVIVFFMSFYCMRDYQSIE